MANIPEIPNDPVQTALFSGGKPTELDLDQAAKEEARKAKLVAEVLQHNKDWLKERRRHEGSWFVNGAFLRSQQHVEYNDATAQLMTPTAPSYKVQVDINRIRPKVRVRLSKFTKAKPQPIVVPASTDYKDVLSARATEKLLRYHWRRLRLGSSYVDARLWASIAARGYWWFSIDQTQGGRVRVKDPLTGQPVEKPVENLGDVNIEVSSAFEVLVADPTISRIGKQPAIQRIRMMNREDVVKRYPDLKEKFQQDGDGTVGSTEGGAKYAERLGTLTANSSGTGLTDIKKGPTGERLLVIEEFTAPCAKYPRGQYVVVAGNQLAKEREELPYDMASFTQNPYPVVEFIDTFSPGQYWNTTFIEQMISLQRQYNYLFELLIENARSCARPKIIVYKQHNLADGAWTNAAGEIVELSWLPGLPAPTILQPKSVASDVWQLINVYDRLFDEISQVYPASEGAVAKSTSGFQTNLLQEATESVHQPDVQEDERSLEEAAWKIRRLCKLWYDVPRIISTIGDNSVPEAIEFSQRQIDENAEVAIQAGSMLPDMKAAKAQTALDLYSAGLFGPADDPMVRKRVLGMLEMSGIDAAQEDLRRDADVAEIENRQIGAGGDVHIAQWYEDHVIHLDRHTAFMKSPAFARLDAQSQKVAHAHAIGHLDWVNPGMAMALRVQLQMEQLPLATPSLPPQMQAGPTPGPTGPAEPVTPPSPEPAPPPGQPPVA